MPASKSKNAALIILTGLFVFLVLILAIVTVWQFFRLEDIKQRSATLKEQRAQISRQIEAHEQNYRSLASSAKADTDPRVNATLTELSESKRQKQDIQRKIGQLSLDIDAVTLRYRLTLTSLLLVILGSTIIGSLQVLRIWSSDELESLTQQSQTVMEAGLREIDLHMEIYLKLNQSQARSSFRVSVFAIIAGLCTFLAGIWIFYVNGETRQTSLAFVSTVGGVLIQFIGGAYLHLHRKTTTQMNAFFARLGSMREARLALELCNAITDRQIQDESKREVALALIKRTATSDQ